MVSGQWNRQTVKALWQLTARYWKSEEKKSAWLYLLGIVVLTMAAVYMTLLLNDWFNEFYSALQNYDSGAVYHGLVRFTAIAFGHIAFSVYAYYLQQTLALRWRRWMTEKYLSRWTARQMFYRLEMFSGGRSDNPDQRISEDINLFTTRTLSFMAGLLKAITTIFCFIFVLWSLSEPLTLPLPGFTIHIYGYLVWTALAYSVIGTWLTHKVGHKLVGLNFLQQKLEADFRYAMVRLRETSESVAFYHGGGEEKKILEGRFHKLLVNTVYIIRKQKQLSWLTNSYGQIAIIFPFVVAAPRYLSRNIPLAASCRWLTVSARYRNPCPTSWTYTPPWRNGCPAWNDCSPSTNTWTGWQRKRREKRRNWQERKGRLLPSLMSMCPSLTGNPFSPAFPAP